MGTQRVIPSNKLNNDAEMQELNQKEQLIATKNAQLKAKKSKKLTKEALAE